MDQWFLNLFFPRCCVGCGQVGAWICAQCRQSSCPACCVLEGELQGVVYFYSFQDEWVHRALRSLKYEGLYELGPEILEAAIGVLAPHELRSLTGVREDTVVVPVPTSSGRRKERGYNQAEVLGQTLARQLGLSCEGKLLGKRERESLVGKGRAEREEMVREAVYLKGGAEVPESVLLVDDVVTTGSTLRMCAEILMKEGVREIRACAVAHQQAG